MNDELLMRFIDGTATPKEVETVIDILTKDDGAVKEWMQMVQAATLAGAEPAFEVHDAEALEFISDVLGKTGKQMPGRVRKKFRLPWIIGSITAVAATAALCLVLPDVQNSGGTDDFTAEISVDTATFTKPSDSVMQENKVQPAETFIADRSFRRPELPQDRSQEGIESEVNERPVLDVLVERDAHNDALSTAGRTEVLRALTVSRPSKTPYRVRVKDMSKEFTFEWDSSGAISTNLSITGQNGELILYKEMIGETDRCPVKASMLADRGKLFWKLTAKYADGTECVETGILEFITAK